MAEILKSVTIGRAADCDLVIQGDKFVSPHHARIDQHSDGRFTIMDEFSTNGTFIRQRGAGPSIRVPLGMAWQLNTGDLVRVGRTEIPWKNA